MGRKAETHGLSVWWQISAIIPLVWPTSDGTCFSPQDRAYYYLVTVANLEPVQKYNISIFDYFFTPISRHLLDWKEWTLCLVCPWLSLLTFVCEHQVRNKQWACVKMTDSSSLIVTSLRLPFVTFAQVKQTGWPLHIVILTSGGWQPREAGVTWRVGQVPLPHGLWGRRSLGGLARYHHSVLECPPHHVHVAGPGLAPGQLVPHGEGLSPEQVCPVSLSQAEMEAMYKHCRQVRTLFLVSKCKLMFQP